MPVFDVVAMLITCSTEINKTLAQSQCTLLTMFLGPADHLHTMSLSLIFQFFLKCNNKMLTFGHAENNIILIICYKSCNNNYNYKWSQTITGLHIFRLLKQCS